MLYQSEVQPCITFAIRNLQYLLLDAMLKLSCCFSVFEQNQTEFDDLTQH